MAERDTCSALLASHHHSHHCSLPTLTAVSLFPPPSRSPPPSLPSSSIAAPFLLSQIIAFLPLHLVFISLLLLAEREGAAVRGSHVGRLAPVELGDLLLQQTPLLVDTPLLVAMLALHLVEPLLQLPDPERCQLTYAQDTEAVKMT